MRYRDVKDLTILIKTPRKDQRDRFDPETLLAFASSGQGTITVAHEDTPDKFTVVQTISTQLGARTMALDTGNHNVYTVTKEFGFLPYTFTLRIYSR